MPVHAATCSDNMNASSLQTMRRLARGPAYAMTVCILSLPATTGAEGLDCSALARQDFSQLPDAPTTIITASDVAASEDLPAYCRIEGIVAPQVRFELRLPRSDWNGRYLMQGCGGLCGIIKIAAADDALARGYAVTTTNMGHSGNPASGMWGYNNRAAEIDFGYRATHVSNIAARALVTAYYGRDADWSYFRGCSTGGRQGLVEAQRYPEDFDGIIAGAPVINETGVGALHLLWSVRANLNDRGNPIMDGRRIAGVREAVLDHCDELDGLRDGLIADPRVCDFKPASLACDNDRTGENCLSADEVGVLEKLYGGPQNSDGDQLYPGGLMPGSEYEWVPALIGLDGQPALALQMPLIGDFLRYLAFAEDPGPGYSIMDFDFDRDPPRLAFMESIYTASNPDLRRFRERGGKLLLYQGWDDLEVTPTNTVEYYELTSRAMGGPDATREFFRLYMLPGVAHCRRGSGADAVDFLSYIEAWVEQGESPERIVAAHLAEPQAYDGLPPLRFPLDDSRVEFRRSVFPYPGIAEWNGQDDVRDADNWVRRGPLSGP